MDLNLYIIQSEKLILNNLRFIPIILIKSQSAHCISVPTPSLQPSSIKAPPHINCWIRDLHFQTTCKSI